MTPEMQALLPTEEDIAFYRENGYYISKKILSDELIDAAIEGSEDIYQGKYDATYEWSNDKNIDKSFGDVFSDRTKYRGEGYACFHSYKIRQLIESEIISAIAAALVDTDEIRYWKDQLIYKPSSDDPKVGVVGYHQDKRYWSNCRSDKMITAWIPFHDCNTNNGCLTVIKGSHKWKNNFSLATFEESNMQYILDTLVDSNGETIEEVPIELEKGQVSFHDCYTIHGSYTNLSGKERRTLSLHLQDGANRYRDLSFLNKKKVIFQHSHDLICRKDEKGRPDYSDPAIFKTLFKRPQDNLA